MKIGGFKPVTRMVALLILGIAAAPVFADEIAKRPAKTVDGEYVSIYAEYETGLDFITAVSDKERETLASALSGQVDARLGELAQHAEPTRVRELQKISAAWFDDESGLPVDIGDDVPEELKGVFGAYRKALENVERGERDGLRRSYEVLIRELDGLAHKKIKAGEMEKAKTLRDEAQALLEANPRPTEKWRSLEATYVKWITGDKRHVRLMTHGNELPSLAFVQGSFAGGGESAFVAPFDEANWGDRAGLLGHSMQNSVESAAYALRDPRLNMADAKLIFYSIPPGNNRKKLIHSSRGFCYLAGVWGYQGNLTKFDVAIDPEDGFYYFTGRTEAYSNAKAIGVEFPEGKVPQFEVSTVEWERGDPVRELIAAQDGICLFAGMSGAFHGGGETVFLKIGKDGIWRLGGRSGQLNTGARALVLKFTSEPEPEKGTE